MFKNKFFLVVNARTMKMQSSVRDPKKSSPSVFAKTDQFSKTTYHLQFVYENNNARFHYVRPYSKVYVGHLKYLPIMQIKL